MTVNVVAIKSAPRDLAEHLRSMADLADAGELTEAVVAYTLNGSYEFTYAASLHQCVLLSVMLKQNCIDRMRA
jgi:hypothetical protein